MSLEKSISDSARNLRLFFLATAILWTVVVASSLLWQTADVRDASREHAQNRDPSVHDTDARSRRRNAGHLMLWLAGLGFNALTGWRLVQTERAWHGAEEHLSRERETLHLLYESSPDAVAVIDRDYWVSRRPTGSRTSSPTSSVTTCSTRRRLPAISWNTCAIWSAIPSGCRPSPPSSATC